MCSQDSLTKSFLLTMSLGFLVIMQLRVTLVLVTVSLILLPFLTGIQSADGQSAVEGTLQVEQPVGNNTYRNLVYIDFSVDWTVQVYYIPWITVKYSYTFDDQNKTTITLPDNSSSHGITFSRVPDTATDYVSSTANISSLANGRHKLTIYAEGSANYDNLGFKDFNCSFSPIYFFVDTPQPTPTPRLTEAPNATVVSPTGDKNMLLLILSAIITAAIIIFVLLYRSRMHHKNGR